MLCLECKLLFWVVLLLINACPNWDTLSYDLQRQNNLIVTTNQSHADVAYAWSGLVGSGVTYDYMKVELYEGLQDGVWMLSWT